MASIEAEMARFEEELMSSGQSESQNGNRGNIHNAPDRPPPMFRPHSVHNQYKIDRADGEYFNQGPPGPPPMSNLSMFSSDPSRSSNSPIPGMPPHPGPSPMGGMHNTNSGPMGPRSFAPGPRPMMAPGQNKPSNFISSNSTVSSAPKVYSAGPQITKPPQIIKRKLDEDPVQPASEPYSNNPFNPLSEAQMPGHGSSFQPSITNQPFTPPTFHSTIMGNASQTSTSNSQTYKNSNQVSQRKKKYIRTAAGTSWEDSSLLEWDPNDYRLFCGDLGNEVTDDVLTRVFNKYTSFQKARVVRDKNSKKTKGYGFVSFKDPNDFIRAMREMNGKYVGNRPIKLRKSNWKERNIENVRKKLKEKKKLGYKV